MHPLRSQAFRTLFSAQIMSVLGVGIMTVALALTAYRLGGVAGAGKMLGLLFAMKMVVYVFFAPIAEAALAKHPPRKTLISLDIARLALLVPMAFADALWQIGALVLVFYAASAAFTPLYQAVIPEIITDEQGYAKALSLSRLAYTVESVASAALSGAALLVFTPNMLFPLAAACFALSVAALLATVFPAHKARNRNRSFLDRLSRGLRIYVATPRLRGLFLVNLALSLGLAWVLVNSVVYAGRHFENPEQSFTRLMVAHGLGAALGAICVPTILTWVSERRVMLFGAFLFSAIGLLILLPPSQSFTYLLWAGFGLASSLVLTPGGLVLTRSAAKPDRPAVFAAQFSMSHAGWLVAYPLAGWLGSRLQVEHALIVLAALCALTALVARRVWPADDPVEKEHTHPDLPDDHPHLHAEGASGPNNRHSHAFHIDDEHLRWVK